jgi:membrane protein implicated in regulation of membrane protease activity
MRDARRVERTRRSNLLTTARADALGPVILADRWIRCSIDPMGTPEDSPVGLAGRIVTATRGSAGPGEVQLRIRGGTEVFIARSKDPLPVGAAVIVLDTLGPRTVVVFPWADPLDSILDLSEPSL